MPNVWTHLIFGQELMNQLGHASMLSDKQLRHVFSLGCQGPDFLFYHNFLPWKKDKKLNQLGSLMHTKACGPFLQDLLSHIQGRGLYNPAVVYALGFLTHHILDRNMHPYVFYKSGFKKWDHQRFEIIMDTLIVRRKHWTTDMEYACMERNICWRSSAPRALFLRLPTLLPSTILSTHRR